jgi:hypothetical protein
MQFVADEGGRIPARSTLRLIRKMVRWAESRKIPMIPDQ